MKPTTIISALVQFSIPLFFWGYFSGRFTGLLIYTETATFTSQVINAFGAIIFLSITLVAYFVKLSPLIAKPRKRRYKKEVPENEQGGLW